MKKILIQIFYILLYAIAGAISGYFGFQKFGTIENDIIPLIWIICSFYAGMLIHVLIHELGHLIFGILSGYQFMSIRFFNLVLIKENNHLHLKSLKIPGTLGQCLLTIDDYHEPFPFILYHLGGSLNNIIFSILFMILSFITHNPYMQSLCFCIFIFGIVTAIMNAIPLSSTIDNDGTNIYNMIKHPVNQYACFQQLKIVEYMNQNDSLKDIDEKYFTVYSYQDLNYSLYMSTTVFACLRELDLDHHQKAYDLAKNILSHVKNINDNYRFILKGIMIYEMLLNNPEDSQIDIMRDKKYMKYTRLLAHDITTLRIEYAYELLHNHNLRKASQILDKFYKVIKTHPYQGEVQFETKQIEYIRHIEQEKTNEINSN